jgi:hypothetical protein
MRTPLNTALFFSDLQQLIGWRFDEFRQAVTARIVLRKQAEEARLEAERERIRKEEAAKLAAQAEISVPPLVGQAEAVPELTPMMPQPGADAIDSPPTLKLGEINARLGFTLSADFLAQLGFVAHQERGSRLYHERDWPRICAALIRHIQAEARPAAASSLTKNFPHGARRARRARCARD